MNEQLAPNNGDRNAIANSLKTNAIITVVCYFFGISLLVGWFLFSKKPSHSFDDLAKQEILLAKLSSWALMTTLICLLIGILSIITVIGPFVVLYIWATIMAVLATVQAVFSLIAAIKLS